MNNLIENIYKASLKLLVPTTPYELYKTIVDEADTIMGTEGGTLYLGEGDELIKAYSSTEADRQVSARKRGFSYSVYISGKPLVLSGAAVRKIHPSFDKKYKSFLIIPLFYGNEPTGVLDLKSLKPKKSYTESYLHALQLFGSIASLAIRKTQAQYEAQKALETRDLFISMAAHELRTPITVIKLYAQMFRKRFSSTENMEYKWTENILKEVNRTIHIVNELLHFDEVRTGRFKFSIDVHALKSILNEAIADSRLSYPDHNFVIQDNLNGFSDLVVGDKEKLLQAFINIVNNAAKFSPAKSVIQISLNPSDENVTVSIEDHGPGIPKHELPHIYEKFYKGKQNETIEGMGLGLSLVKRIIEDSKGNINIESESNKGTKVSIKLPVVSNRSSNA